MPENITGKSLNKGWRWACINKAVSKLLNKTIFWSSLVNCRIKEADGAMRIKMLIICPLLGKTFVVLKNNVRICQHQAIGQQGPCDQLR